MAATAADAPIIKGRRGLARSCSSQGGILDGAASAPSTAVFTRSPGYRGVAPGLAWRLAARAAGRGG
jgi:hypothetical protein